MREAQVVGSNPIRGLKRKTLMARRFSFISHQELLYLSGQSQVNCIFLQEHYARHDYGALLIIFILGRHVPPMAHEN